MRSQGRLEPDGEIHGSAERRLADVAPQLPHGRPEDYWPQALTRDAGGDVWPSDDRGLPPRTCTCEEFSLTGHHHEACPALDDR